NLPAILQSLIGQHLGARTDELARLACPACGIKYMEFRAQGRLGCPHDYQAFRVGLEPLLRRVHRARRDVGAAPRRGRAPPGRAATPNWSSCADGCKPRSRPRRTRRPPACATCSERGKPRMNLDNLTHTSGEWLRGTGPDSDIVISSRIRLARNLAAFPFTNRASGYQKAEIEGLMRDRIAKLEVEPRLDYIHLAGLSPLDRQFLVERQLVSRELAAAEGPRGVAVAPHETMSVMVNEEDHLRLQVMRSGFALDEAWQDIDRLDDQLEQKISYAFSEEFGYLTACPTNVGTGM